MKKKFRLQYAINADGLLPWAVEQWYAWTIGGRPAGRWCVIGRFYRRSDGRVFLRVKKGLKPQCRRKAVDKELNWDGTERSLADWSR
jgi:hypothetical protein